MISFSLLPLGQGDFDAKGCYQVRSGYRVVMESRMTASSTNLNPDSKWWRLLWRLQLPFKVELLIWRAFHDIIRTWTALRRRGVNCDAACPRRNNGMETTSHALLECSVSLEVCHLSRLWPTLCLIGFLFLSLC